MLHSQGGEVKLIRTQQGNQRADAGAGRGKAPLSRAITLQTPEVVASSNKLAVTPKNAPVLESALAPARSTSPAVSRAKTLSVAIVEHASEPGPTALGVDTSSPTAPASPRDVPPPSELDRFSPAARHFLTNSPVNGERDGHGSSIISPVNGAHRLGAGTRRASSSGVTRSPDVRRKGSHQRVVSHTPKHMSLSHAPTTVAASAMGKSSGDSLPVTGRVPTQPLLPVAASVTLMGGSGVNDSVCVTHLNLTRIHTYGVTSTACTELLCTTSDGAVFTLQLGTSITGGSSGPAFGSSLSADTVANVPSKSQAICVANIPLTSSSALAALTGVTVMEGGAAARSGQGHLMVLPYGGNSSSSNSTTGAVSSGALVSIAASGSNESHACMLQAAPFASLGAARNSSLSFHKRAAVYHVPLRTVASLLTCHDDTVLENGITAAGQSSTGRLVGVGLRHGGVLVLDTKGLHEDCDVPAFRPVFAQQLHNCAVNVVALEQPKPKTVSELESRDQLPSNEPIRILSAGADSTLSFARLRDGRVIVYCDLTPLWGAAVDKKNTTDKTSALLGEEDRSESSATSRQEDSASTMDGGEVITTITADGSGADAPAVTTAISDEYDTVIMAQWLVKPKLCVLMVTARGRVIIIHNPPLAPRPEDELPKPMALSGGGLTSRDPNALHVTMFNLTSAKGAAVAIPTAASLCLLPTVAAAATALPVLEDGITPVSTVMPTASLLVWSAESYSWSYYQVPLSLAGAAAKQVPSLSALSVLNAEDNTDAGSLIQHQSAGGLLALSHPMPGHQQRPLLAAASSDGVLRVYGLLEKPQTAASSTSSGSMLLCQLLVKAPFGNFECGGFTSMAFSGDNEHVIVGTADGASMVCNIATLAGDQLTPAAAAPSASATEMQAVASMDTLLDGIEVNILVGMYAYCCDDAILTDVFD